jgi:phosphoesterase RecJ-like protein
VASYLVSLGASTEAIAGPVFRSQSFAQSRLRAQVIVQAQRTCNDRLIYSYVSAETLAKLDIHEPVDDGAIGALRDIVGVEVAIIFKNDKDPNATRLSLRSHAPFDCAAFCQRFGGGGHARAAGASVSQPLEETMKLVLPELERALLAEG